MSQVAPPAFDGVLDLRGVVMSYPAPGGERRVLDGVDLTVGRGEVVAVAGRSGSGKTTLLTLVAGMEPPDAGDIYVIGDDVVPARRSWREVAILPQALGLLDELTVRENIELPLRLAEAGAALDAPELMAGLGIEHLADRFPSEVSLGEQQRTALARAVIARPDVLLADEPISHQNHAWSTVMMDLVADLAASGTTCLLATHNEVAFDVAHRVLELRAGHLYDRRAATPRT